MKLSVKTTIPLFFLIVLAGLFCAFAYFGHVEHPVFYVFALAVVAFVFLGEASMTEKQQEAFVVVANVCLFGAAIACGAYQRHSNDHVVATALLDRAYVPCFSEKGDLDACVKEASALTGREPRFVVAFNKWTPVYPLCKEKLGVDLCVRELDKLGVNLKPLVSVGDLNALCPQEGFRTECLLSLAESGFPLAKLDYSRGKS